MTYREYLDDLANHIKIAEMEYNKASIALGDEGVILNDVQSAFFDVKLLIKERKTYGQWQELLGLYNGIMNFTSKNNIDLDSELSIPLED